jgi:hypothetical protein
MAGPGWGEALGMNGSAPGPRHLWRGPAGPFAGALNDNGATSKETWRGERIHRQHGLQVPLGELMKSHGDAHRYEVFMPASVEFETTAARCGIAHHAGK